MKKYTTLLLLVLLLLGFGNLRAQVSCNDLNGYVDYKNTNAIGGYTLEIGSEELAAQTYEYSGPGKITSVRVYGDYPGVIGGVALKVSIYNVDANGRPTTTIQSVNDTWWWFDNNTGYITVNFGGGGVFVENDFAVGVSIRSASPWGTSFQVGYTGDGEGNGEDLASLAGTSTGQNWTSAMTNFSKDGDFYLVPRMSNFITSSFTKSATCVGTGTTVDFTNTSAMSIDRMFNTIGLAGYSGTNHFYSWSFGDGSAAYYGTNASHAYAAPGRYTVSLTCTIDGWGNDCSDVYSTDISVGLAATPSAMTNVSCNGGSDGSVTVIGSGGAAPYQYSLTGEGYQGSNTFTGLAAGTYTVHIEDALGCTSTATFTITQPSAIVFGTPASTNASCGGADGAILVSATGGVGALEYALGQGAFQSSGSFTGLAAGTYTVTVKDANNCTKWISVAVEDNGGPTLTAMNWGNVSCYNGNDGWISLSASGGAGTLQYSVNNGVTFQTSGMFSNLTAGIYHIIVKDAAQCTEIRKITLNQPQQLTLTASSEPVSCNGGSDGEIDVTSAIGGTGSIVYSVNGVTYQSGTMFLGLGAGTYTVYAKDVAGCIATTSITITQPTAVGATFAHTNATCNGNNDGTITASGTGGVGNYSYSLDGVNYQTTGSFGELAAGTYTVWVMDDNGCNFSGTVTISQPTSVAATVTTTNSTCGNSNGGILLSASGGSGAGYQYSIDGTTFFTSGLFSNLASGTYFIRVKDGAGCEIVVVATVNDSNGPSITSTSYTNVACHAGNDGSITVNSVSGGTGTLQYSINGLTWQTSTVFSGLGAGTYTVTVKDQNGCTGIATITLTEPNAFVMNTSVVNATCNGSANGSMTITASGGAGNFAYSLNGVQFQTSSLFTGLAAGTYTVTVRDAGGCMASTSFTVTEPTAIEAFASVLNVSCHGAADGSINVSAFGGTGTLRYSINGLNYQLSSTFLGLSGGVYTVYVKDGNNCIHTTNVTVLEPTPLSVSASLANVACAGGDDGVINLSVSGATGPYSFMWSNGASDEDIFHLYAGSYAVTVSDENGCTEMMSFTITEPANPMILNGTVTNATAALNNDGEIDITVTGGDGPYTFNWSNGATTEDVHNLLPGIYVVVVTDVNGCATSNTYVVGITTAVAGGMGDFNVSLYPNPANNRVFVETTEDAIQQVLVYDMVGQVVMDLQPNTQKAELDLMGLSAGNYIVKVKVNETFKVKRLQVNR